MPEEPKPFILEEQTKMIAKERGLLPNTKVYRWLHPAVISGIEDGRILLLGNRSNGTAVNDVYGSSPVSKRASDLDDPGLNFTYEISEKYRSGIRRLAVSLQMAQQPQKLRIYPDLGSEVRAAYFTLPADSFFHVTAEKFDPVEVAIVLKMRSYMNQRNLTEEPGYHDWLESGEGVRVTAYLPKTEGGEQYIEVPFLKRGENSYLMDTSSISELPGNDAIEGIALYRFLLENRDFASVIFADRSTHAKDTLLQEIMTSKEYELALGLRK